MCVYATIWHMHEPEEESQRETQREPQGYKYNKINK